MSETEVASNPLPVDRAAFIQASLILVVTQAVPGEHDTALEGIIDVAGDSGLHRGDVVKLEWPFAIAQDGGHRPIAFPVRKRSDGSYLALSAGMTDRDAIRLVTGRSDDNVPASPDDVHRLVEQANAIGSYSWTVDPGSDGTHVEATLYRTYKGSPPRHLPLHTPESDEPGGSWTFFDGMDIGANFGVLFLAKRADNSWGPITDTAPWTFGTKGLPAPID